MSPGHLKKPSLRKILGILMFVLAFALVVFATFALADPTGPGSLTVGSSSRANLTNTIKSAPAEAGNITELDLNADTITKSWQGYYGNITGELVLADAQGNNFYVWNGSQATGQIFASRNDSIDWTSINCTNLTGINQENAYLSKSSTEADSVNKTFSSTTHPSFVVGTRTMTGCFSARMNGPSGPSGQNFWNVILSDGNGNGTIVYTTLINRSTTSFKNTLTDFELMVGENGNATSLAPTSYYFYVELD